MTESLELKFKKGTLPKNLDGFYKGKLLKLTTHTLINALGEFIAQIWFPWSGKTFYKITATGDNVVFGTHKIPFKTYASKNTLILDYDLPENNSKVRNVVDELVEVEKNKYLGKAFVKRGSSKKLIAYFSLEKN